MNRAIGFWGLLSAMLVSFSVYAGDIQVDSAWARATAPGQDAAMVDLTITSSKEARLVGFSSAVCRETQMHSMIHDKGMMKMREVTSVDLPAGRRISLGEAGFHLMLLGLKSPLRAGDSVPLTLNVVTADKTQVKVEVNAVVKPLNEVSPQNEHMHHMHH